MRLCEIQVCEDARVRIGRNVRYYVLVKLSYVEEIRRFHVSGCKGMRV